MDRRKFLQMTVAAGTGVFLSGSALSKTNDLVLQTLKSNPSKYPNIVIILADDLGYGDLSCYDGIKLKTPNIDRMAEEGIKFTNGYAASATCTPSRYSLLTGAYPWRKKDAAILPGDAPLLIDENEITLPSMLKKAGYKTAIVGKWHLGLGNGNVDWNKQINPGPNERGFDYSFIMPATTDRVPTVYVENGLIQNLDPNDPLEVSYEKNFPGQPTGKDNPQLLRLKASHGHDNTIINGVGRIGFAKGGKSAIWNDETMAETFLGKAVDFVSKNKGNPFFLYYALHEPHVPRLPGSQFLGKSGLGPRGDSILEADWCVGQFLDFLKKENLEENTLVIFSSDNGPVLDDGYQDEAVEKNDGHTPAGLLRGGKYSLYDGGTRVPFIVKWNGKIKPGTSNALVSQVDFFASFAAMTNQKNNSVDSEDVLGAFLGKTNNGRNDIVLEGIKHNTVYREGSWVLIPPYPGVAILPNVNIESGNSNVYQLYDLNLDIGEQKNLAEKYPEKVKSMIKKLEGIKKMQ